MAKNNPIYNVLMDVDSKNRVRVTFERRLTVYNYFNISAAQVVKIINTAFKCGLDIAVSGVWQYVTMGNPEVEDELSELV